MARRLKITEKVTFKIVSEASYVYILSRQKLVKKCPKGPLWRFFETLFEACGRTVLPDRSFLIGQKMVENVNRLCKIKQWQGG